MTALAIQHREHIISSLQAGILLKQIAAKLKVSGAAISQQLAQDPEYRLARESGAEERLELREEELEKADTSLSVARADRLLGHQRWRCEREFPQRWGAKTELRGSRDAPLFGQVERETMLLEIARSLAFTLASAAAAQAQSAPALIEHDASEQQTQA